MSLEKEFNYFIKNKEDLLKSFLNKFVVIISDKVVGSYDSQEEALREASKQHKAGTFLIQKVSTDDTDTTQKFFSMVYF